MDRNKNINSSKIVKRNVLFASLLLAISSASSASTSVRIDGEIELSLPDLKLESAEAPVAFVNSEKIYINQIEEGGCQLVYSADKSGKDSDDDVARCYVKVTELPNGLSKSEGSSVIDGVPQAFGDLPVKIETYFYSGTNRTPILIRSDVHNLTILEPIAPKLSSFKTGFRKNVSELPVTMIHDRANRMKNIVLNVEPRRYDQKLTVPGFGSCSILRGRDKCIINTGFVAFENAPFVGEKMSNIYLSSFNNYFNNLDGREYGVKWDFTPPEIKDYSLRVDSNNVVSLQHVHSIGDVYPDNEQMLVYIKSKHLGLEDPNYVGTQATWMIPEEDDINVTLYAVDKTGNRLEGARDIHLKVDGSQVNESGIFYKISLNDLPDGYYRGKIQAKDKYGNEAVDVEVGISYFDRKPPVITIMKGNSELNDNEEVYFLSDIWINITDGNNVEPVWDDLLVNGNKIDITSTDKEGWYRFVEPETGSVEPNNPEMEIIVSGHDANENIALEKRIVNYMPMEYSLSGVRDILYEKITNNDFNIRQSKGRHCTLKDSENEAVSTFASYGLFSCTVEPLELPEGFELADSFGIKSFQGRFQSDGEQTLKYNVYAYSKYGDKVLASKNTEKFDVLKPPVPTIEIKSNNDIINGRYVSTTDGGVVARALVSSNGEVEFWPESDINDEDHQIRLLNSRAKFHWLNTSQSATVYASPGELWSEETIKLSARYLDMPEMITSVEVPVIKGPPNRGIYLKADGILNKVINTEKYTISLSFGEKVSGVEGLVYNPDKLGDWDVYLAKYESGKLVPATDKIKYEGEPIDFDIDLSGSSTSISLLPVAELKSPYPEYKRKITASKIRSTILNGRAINGDIDISVVSDIIPFTTRTKILFDSKLDQKSVKDITWLSSRDNGQTWTPIEDTVGKSQIYIPITTEGSLLVKAMFTNKYTEIKSETAPVKIIGFTKPEFIINGPRVIFPGQIANINVELTKDNPEDVIIEYSEDGGKTWKPFSQINAKGENGDHFYFQIRARYKKAPEDNADSWNVGRYSVSVKPVRSPRASIYGPTRIEAGTLTEFNVSVRSPYSLMQSKVNGEWVMPDGKVIPGDGTVQYTPQVEDIQNGFIYIKYRSWIEGYKEESLKESVGRFRAWNYSFPVFTADVTKTLNVAPTTAKIVINPYGVRIKNLEGLTYEWEYPEGISLENDNLDYLKVVKINEPGDKTIILHLKDERGNSQELAIPISAYAPANYSVTFKDRLPKVVRDPVDLSIRANLSGGHPRDSIEEQSWLLDGNKLDINGSYAVIKNIGQGHHDVTYQIKSKFGIIDSFVYSLDVEPNKPPVCEFRFRDSGPFKKIYSSCKDEDGRVNNYKWMINDEVVGSGRSISYLIDDQKEQIVTLIVTDDSGEEVKYEDIK